MTVTELTTWLMPGGWSPRHCWVAVDRFGRLDRSRDPATPPTTAAQRVPTSLAGNGLILLRLPTVRPEPWQPHPSRSLKTPLNASAFSILELENEIKLSSLRDGRRKRPSRQVTVETSVKVVTKSALSAIPDCFNARQPHSGSAWMIQSP